MQRHTKLISPLKQKQSESEVITGYLKEVNFVERERERERGVCVMQQSYYVIVSAITEDREREILKKGTDRERERKIIKKRKCFFRERERECEEKGHWEKRREKKREREEEQRNKSKKEKKASKKGLVWRLQGKTGGKISAFWSL